MNISKTTIDVWNVSLSEHMNYHLQIDELVDAWNSATRKPDAVRVPQTSGEGIMAAAMIKDRGIPVIPECVFARPRKMKMAE